MREALKRDNRGDVTMPPRETHLDRRDFLGLVTGGAAATLASSGRALWGQEAAPERPNVILIFSDDQGTLDVNCYGSDDLYTPHLDGLAAQGTRFTQFYVAAPICSPSRAALLTGRYPQRAQLATNAGGKRAMPTEQVTLAEMLRDARYRTAIFGKWHLGEQPGSLPLDQGFEEFFGHRNGCIDNYSHFFYWAGPNRHDLWRGNEEVWEDGAYFPDLMVREAKRFLRANSTRAFFLYLPFNIPHYPLQGQAEFREMYRDMPEPRRSYAALVSTFDAKVGEVLAEVDRLGLRDNTLVVFLSDNGHSTEERNNFGGGNAGPYRGAKFSLLEGGIRVPCIARLPGRIPAGEVREQMAMSFDWFPTIAELCGVALPEQRVDGESLVPVFESAKAPSPHEVLHWQLGGQWAVREGDWKLVANARDTRPGSQLNGDDATFLSNMAEDVTETSNLAKAHPDTARRLTELHEEWVEDVER